MKYVILITILCNFSCLLNAQDYALTIGTNTFNYVFEDTTLSTQMQNRILLDLKTMQSPWTNRECIFFPNKRDYLPPMTIGYIQFEQIYGNPFFCDDKYVNDILFTTNKQGRFEIPLLKQFTDIYTNSFAFVDNHMDEWIGITNFLNLLSPESLTNLPIGGFDQIHYHPDVPKSEYIMVHDKMISQFLETKFYIPSVLALSLQPAGFLGFATEALWLALPCSYRETSSKNEMHDVIFCVWHNNRWFYWIPPL